jgi:hypothetical protein
MRNNIKQLMSSPWWRELKIEIEKRIAEVEIEILTEADINSPSIDKLRKLSSDRKALKEIIELPESLIISWEEVEDII